MCIAYVGAQIALLPGGQLLGYGIGAYGIDNAYAGFRQVGSGESRRAYLNQGIAAITDQQFADDLDFSAQVVIGLGGPAAVMKIGSLPPALGTVAGSDAATASSVGSLEAADLFYVSGGQTPAQIASNVVRYGETDLSQIAIAFRRANEIRGARNVAVFEYQTEEGLKTIARASERGVGHSERIIANELQSMGVAPSQVTRIYSELQPCSVPGGYCDAFIQRTFPGASVSYTFEYG